MDKKINGNFWWCRGKIGRLRIAPDRGSKVYSNFWRWQHESLIILLLGVLSSSLNGIWSLFRFYTCIPITAHKTHSSSIVDSQVLITGHFSDRLLYAPDLSVTLTTCFYQKTQGLSNDRILSAAVVYSLASTLCERELDPKTGQ